MPSLSLCAGVAVAIIASQTIAANAQSEYKGPPGDAKSATDSGTVTYDAKSLAAVLRPRLPKGWKMSMKDDAVIVEREKPVEWYNAINLPYSANDKQVRAYVKPHLQREKLTLKFYLGERLDADRLARIDRKNMEAVESARKAKNDGKFMPDDSFWQAHPEYGYREAPKPILDTGVQGIYMDVSPRGAIVQPSNKPHLGGHALEFYDKKVGEECQGFVDGLAMIFKAYPGEN